MAVNREEVQKKLIEFRALIAKEKEARKQQGLPISVRTNRAAPTRAGEIVRDFVRPFKGLIEDFKYQPIEKGGMSLRDSIKGFFEPKYVTEEAYKEKLAEKQRRDIRYKEHAEGGTYYPYVGTIESAITPKQKYGRGAQIASNIPLVGGTSTVVKTLGKSALKESLKRLGIASAEGFLGGAAFGAGESIEQGASTKEVIKNALKTGTVTGLFSLGLGSVLKSPTLTRETFTLLKNMTPEQRVAGTIKIPDILNDFIEKSKKLSKQEFIEEFQKGLTTKNLTFRDIAQKTEKEIKSSGFDSIENFYDEIVSPQRKKITVYNGSNKVTSEVQYDPGKTLTFKNDQQDVIRELAKSGNKEAKKLVEKYGKSKIAYTEADDLLEKLYADTYDSIRFENNQMPQRGGEYLDLRDGKSYADKKELADLYAMQNRGDKYQFITSQKVNGKEISKSAQQQLNEVSQGVIPPYAENIPQGIQKGKERKFIQSVRESPRVPEETKIKLEQLPEEQRIYDVYSNAEALKRAQNMADDSMDKALDYVLTSDEMSKDVVTTGIELMRRYRLQGNYEMESRIAGRLAERLTKGGQFVQAASMLNKLSPEGILVYAQKRIGKPLSKELSDKLVEKVTEIQNLPFGYEKIKQTQDLAGMINNEIPRSISEKAKEWLEQLANVPRTLMSSFLDFSFGLRQGAVAATRFPKEFAEAFKAQFKPFANEKAYEDVMDTVLNNKDFKLASESGLGLTDINTGINSREEMFMSSWAEKIPGIGDVIRATNRAYTAMANKLRMDVYSTMVKNAQMVGNDPYVNEPLAREIASFVNDITGRGNMPQVLENAAPLLNAMFYSPRLMASRLNLLFPKKYIMASPMLRKEYLKTMLAFGTTVTTILALADLHPDVTVVKDPRNADFGKIKIGNTRFDIMGGFQQYIRIAAQLITGKYVSSSTGKVITLGEGYKPLTRLQILGRGLESKEAPVFSLLTTLLKGQDFEGEKISIPKEIGKRFIPMTLSSLYDIYKDDPTLLPIGALSIFGIGTQTYQPPEAYVKMEEINKSNNPAQAFEQLKKENPKLAEKVKKAKVESTFNEFDWGLTYMGVENGERARFLYERMNSMPKEEAAILWEDLRAKKLISERVADQIKLLIENPN